MATSKDTFISDVQNTCAALAEVMARIARLDEEYDNVFATGKALVLVSGDMASKSVTLTQLEDALTALGTVRTSYLTTVEDVLGARP